ncbi:MAG: hypothetical protein QG656_878 [Candidatus Hydrogenedentes bacterium]|nr:hypothetical protein [Candidatus Hydrogenedentota bacterium]
MNITFVVPVYNERDTLEALAEGIAANVAPHAHRILFIDDGSTDGSFETLCALQQRFSNVDIVRFRRNFGKSAALAAGFARAEGDLVFTMDADLQDDPREIPRFIAKLEEGYDVVSGWKKERHDPWHKTVPSRIFNGLVARQFGLDIHDINCGFKLYRAEVVKNVPMYGELHRLIPALAASLGYRVAEIPVQHHPRRFGQSKYGFERFSRGAMDALSVWFLGRYLYSPGHLFGKAAMAAWALAALSLLGAAACGTAAWAIIGVVLAMGGFLLLGQGLVAELAVRHRPSLDTGTLIAEERRGK